MAVIQLQLFIVTPLILLPFNILYQKLNTPFADYGSMQYFVEKCILCSQPPASRLYQQVEHGILEYIFVGH